MSCFIVSDDTINNIVPLFATPGLPCEWLDEIGANLLTINHKAYQIRYKQPEDTAPQPFRYVLKFPPTKLQQLKSLQCWIYQCSEGEPMQSDPLFVQAKKLERDLLRAVVADLPEYQRATWG